jgi:uncharacterized protein YndB with AHSA1/START domain
MAENAIFIDAPPDDVFAVLADPERYVEWVVGTADTTPQDRAWPAPGSRLRYHIGLGRLGFSDVTEVVEARRPERIVLRARMSPLGTTAIEIDLRHEPPGTRLVMREEPASGLVRVTHTRLTDIVLGRRNEAALRRLRRLVERDS